MSPLVFWLMPRCQGAWRVGEVDLDPGNGGEGLVQGHGFVNLIWPLLMV